MCAKNVFVLKNLRSETTKGKPSLPLIAVRGYTHYNTNYLYYRSQKIHVHNNGLFKSRLYIPPAAVCSSCTPIMKSVVTNFSYMRKDTQVSKNQSTKITAQAYICRGIFLRKCEPLYFFIIDRFRRTDESYTLYTFFCTKQENGEAIYCVKTK